jgi:hypothetical protein
MHLYFHSYIIWGMNKSWNQNHAYCKLSPRQHCIRFGSYCGVLFLVAVAIMTSTSDLHPWRLRESAKKQPLNENSYSITVYFVCNKCFFCTQSYKNKVSNGPPQKILKSLTTILADRQNSVLSMTSFIPYQNKISDQSCILSWWKIFKSLMQYLKYRV